MALLRALTDVDVAGTKSERPGHGLLLVLGGGAREIENRSRNPVSSLGRSLMPSAGSSDISQPRTPDQKCARPGGSFASKQSPKR